MSGALVLAGGDVAGIAWELGVLQGLRDVDPELQERVCTADVIVGTSAGSAVAAQITTPTPLPSLYSAQLSPTSSELDVDLDLEELTARFAEATAGATSPEELRRRVGALALETSTVSEDERRRAVAARLPRSTWPERPLQLTAVDAHTGALTVFTKDSGVELTDAVTASCAVPGVWPPVTINGRGYIDGGVRSGSNADLAQGCDRVLVITPSLPGGPELFGSLTEDVEALKPTRVEVIYADDASVAAFGTNPLSPATRGPAARAGRRVGTAEAGRVDALWR
jgi:NTE family protein